MTSNHLSHLLLLTLLLFVRSGAVITPTELPASIQSCYDKHVDTSLRDVVGESFCYFCEEKNIQAMTPIKGLEPSDPASLNYIAGLVQEIVAIKSRGRVRRQVEFPPCLRKEYRMMTDAERNLFHEGLNALKRNQEYDVLAGLHSGFVINSAHNGPNFLGWHRVYLLLMENALRRIDSRICLPYWDSSLDSELGAASNIFSPTFLGGRRRGPVTDGPFAGWRMPWRVPLIRNVGAGGQLYTETAIRNILNQTRTFQITVPDALFPNNLEFNHNGVHTFVGGQMSQLQTAAFDPGFFLHHCFVDYLWETFRNRQRSLGIDPELDYPTNFGSPLHAPDIALGFGFNLTAQDGYLNSIGAAAQYDPSPTCSRHRPDCGSIYLQCDTSRNRCIPVSPSVRIRRAVRYPPASLLPGPQESCMNDIIAVQNDFCIDGVCDIRKWVYVAVNVISNRPPGFKSYSSYPVLDGEVVDTYDVYQPSAYIDTARYSYPSGSAPKHYDRCSSSESGQVYVQATGLNYNGVYKESSLVDQRLATAISVAYVAVKNPKRGPVKALFRAFDKCGRLCKPACRIPGTKKFRTCSGAMEISNVPGKPKQYSYSYGQASAHTLDIEPDSDCPSLDGEEIALTFYCDYTTELPWTSPSAAQQLRKMPRAQTPPQPVTTECRVDQECRLSVPCGAGPCQEGDSYRCKGSCSKYAECRHGVFWKKTCPPGSAFDHKTMSCIRGGICLVRQPILNTTSGRRLVIPSRRQSHIVSRLGLHPDVLSPSLVNRKIVIRHVKA